jgi:hydroxyacylglutathione hydrolase
MPSGNERRLTAHFDHVGRIQEYPDVAFLDLPALRDEVHSSVFTAKPDQYGLNRPCAFRVSRWLSDGEVLDLGDGRITVLSTPGHTPESVTLLDQAGHMASIGDLVCRIMTLYGPPGAGNQGRLLIECLPAGASTPTTEIASIFAVDSC